jgi:hypothetical protein
MFDNPPTPAMDLTNSVMVVNLCIASYAGEKVDRKVTREVEERNNTDSHNTGRFTKQIVTKRALKGIKQLAGEARTTHYERTLPWNDNGGRLLSVIGYMDYIAAMGRLSELYQREVVKFMDAYQRGLITDEARTRLKGLFDINDYPPNDDMRRRFTFDLGFEPLPSSKNWLMDIADNQMAALQAGNEQRVADRIAESVKDAYRRVADVTGKMAERLNAYERDPDTNKLTGGKFRDSLVENVRELSSLLPSLNLTNDPVLEDINKQLRELTRFDAEQLRTAEPMRVETAAKATELFEFVCGML